MFTHLDISKAKVISSANKRWTRLILENLNSNNPFNLLDEIDKDYIILPRPMMQNIKTNRRTMHQNERN